MRRAVLCLAHTLRAGEARGDHGEATHAGSFRGRGCCLLPFHIPTADEITQKEPAVTVPTPATMPTTTREATDVIVVANNNVVERVGTIVYREHRRLCLFELARTERLGLGETLAPETGLENAISRRRAQQEACGRSATGEAATADAVLPHARAEVVVLLLARCEDLGNPCGEEHSNGRVRMGSLM